MRSDDHYVETLLAVGARNDEIALGGLITCIAEHAGVELRGRVPIGRVSTLDTSLLGPGQLNLLFKDNDYFWRVAQGELIALPNPEYTTIRVSRNIKMDHPTMPQVAAQLPDLPSPNHGNSSRVEDQLRRRPKTQNASNFLLKQANFRDTAGRSLLLYVIIVSPTVIVSEVHCLGFRHRQGSSRYRVSRLALLGHLAHARGMITPKNQAVARDARAHAKFAQQKFVRHQCLATFSCNMFQAVSALGYERAHVPASLGTAVRQSRALPATSVRGARGLLPRAFGHRRPNVNPS
ncbi:cell elongation protein [Striga asiatica]|uniref:Cell elongation protein n=1 Tax=Striga asiatica TaxID=4170 RepID=A0A5A7PHY4_STRAF|nr:cell elongation protein [Striga asiatica]